MSLLSKLFGKSEPKEPESVEYNGFKITPQPMREGSEYRLSALIEKDDKSHHVIRADVLSSADAANEAAIIKAKQVIDQQGDQIFL